MRRSFVIIRVSSDERLDLERRSKAVGLSVSSFLRKLLNWPQLRRGRKGIEGVP